jgi:uncharacterized protein YlxW (UPF0749 family)
MKVFAAINIILWCIVMAFAVMMYRQGTALRRAELELQRQQQALIEERVRLQEQFQQLEKERQDLALYLQTFSEDHP